MLVFLECPSLSFQSFCLPHRLPLFLSYLPFYPIITLPMPRSHFLPPGSCDHYTSVVRGWWCSVKPEGFKVQVAILSLFLVSALSLAGIVINKKSLPSFFLFWHNPSFFFFSPSAPPLPSFSCSLILSPFLCFHCISMFLFFSPPHFLCVSVSLSLSLCRMYFLSSLEEWKTFWSSTRGVVPSALIHFMLVTGAYSMAHYCVPRCFVNFTRELNISCKLCTARSHN